MDKAEKKGIKLILPTDVVLADKFANDATTAVAMVNEISGDCIGLDIGPETVEMFAKEIKQCNTIVFNGPMGVFEMPPFDAGTKAVAKAIADSDSTRETLSIPAYTRSIKQAGSRDICAVALFF